RRRLALVALALAGVATAAVSAAATASPTRSHAAPPLSGLNYQLYVGGKGKANPRLAPVTIGFINGQGGPPNFNFPQPTAVMEAAVRMATGELARIHRHPLKLN